MFQTPSVRQETILAPPGITANFTDAFKDDIGFDTLSVAIDNFTGYWLYVPGAANPYIPPFWVGVVRNVIHANTRQAVQWASPFGNSQNPAVRGAFVNVTFTNYILPYAPGSLAGLPDTTAGGGSGGVPPVNVNISAQNILDLCDCFHDGPNLCQGQALLPSGYYPPICVSGTISGVDAITGPDGIIVYSKPGDGYTYSFDPLPGFHGGWHFPQYNQASATNPSFKQDEWGTLASNTVQMIVCGSGHITVYIGDFIGGAAATTLALYHQDSTGTSAPIFDSSITTTVPNSTVEFDLGGADLGICRHLVTMADGPGSGGGAIGFGGFQWDGLFA